MSHLRPALTERLRDLFQDRFKSVFHGFYIGDPIILPQSMLPAVIISEPETAYDVGPTGMDEVRHSILIQLVFNKKDDFGRDDKSATLEKRIDDLAQGRDEDTGEFVKDSFMGVLRNNLTLDNIVHYSINSVRKGVVPRSEELTTVEAHIEGTFDEFVIVNSRT